MRVAAEGTFDGAHRMLRSAHDEPEIRARDRPAHHRFAEGSQRLLGFGDHEQARSVPIQAVDEAGPQRVAGQRAGVSDERICEGAVARSVGWMRDHARGFVDDQQRVVFEDDVERNIFGLRFENEHVFEREL